MSFGSQLKEYLALAGGSAKELAEASGISPAQISRYVNDKRMPREDSEQFENLIHGLCIIAQKNGVTLDKEEIAKTLTAFLPAKRQPSEEFVVKLNMLITGLKINASDLAYSLNYDASFLSRIRNGTRVPSNIEAFSAKVASYAFKHYNDRESIETVSNLIGVSPVELSTSDAYCSQLAGWLVSMDLKVKPVEEFLSVLNESIVSEFENRTERPKLPSSPIMPRISKHYYGIDGMKKAEADFFRYTILSSAKDNMFLYSDINMDEVDEKQFDKLVAAANALIEKGIGLDLIHNINRPINEMLIGLQGWLPLYMKGNINPYYLEGVQPYMFSQILATSGSAALQGECFGDRQDSVHLKMTTNRHQVEWYRKKSDYMLSAAKPLMRIYRENEEQKFLSFIEAESKAANIITVKKDEFENIDFCYAEGGKWLCVNKVHSPKVHFVIFNGRLISSIKELLNS